MSLLDVVMEDCIIMNKTIAPDGYGGYDTTWTEGAPFSAAIVLDTSLAARVAEKEGVHNVYTVTTPRALVFDIHDVFMRVSDSKYFRVTSDGTDNKTPVSTDLDMRQVSAEEFVLP